MFVTKLSDQTLDVVGGGEIYIESFNAKDREVEYKIKSSSFALVLPELIKTLHFFKILFPHHRQVS